METTLRSLSGRAVLCVCTNFPLTGAEEAMIKVRKKLELVISQIDVAPVPESMVSPNAHEKDTFKVHAVYELNALCYYWNTIKSSGNPILVGNKNIDDIWIEREVLPSWLHYSFIVNCCSFIEDQVSALLAENPDLRNLHFMKCFDEMFRVYGKQELLDNRPQLTGEIRVLREIRNMIVHRGGRIDPLYGREYLLKKEIQDCKGLDIEPSGHIIVEEQFCEYALALVERFVRYITQFNTRY